MGQFNERNDVSVRNTGRAMEQLLLAGVGGHCK